MVTYPSDVSLISSSACQVASSGSVYSMTCYHEQYVRRITMKNGFTGEVAAGGQIELVLGRWENPLEEAGTSFRVAIYSDQDTQYIIDEANSGMVPGIECVVPCKSCAGLTQKSVCTSCHEPGTTDIWPERPYLLDYDCYQECPVGYYADQNYNCQACHWECGTCSDYYTCLTCSETSDYEYFYQNKCYEDCPVSTYQDRDDNCAACNSPCRECTGPENGECTACL